MRVIHCSAGNGATEWILFTDETSPPEDFFSASELQMEGFEVEFDGEIELPGSFFPGDADVYKRFR